MYEPKVSVVIVSRDRPDGLARLITSLRFQFYKTFEVIVVSNEKSVPFERVKHIYFDEPNISAARNLGIEAAAGELIAFCDDDAVPEPTWLEYLIEPFQNQSVGVAGGFVRGRNGIDFQWKAQQVDCFGNDRPVELETEERFTIQQGDAGYVPKVQGTNCIFRKSTLLALDGFDEGFQFYLDETDVCIRATRAGWSTVVVPNAEVQHGFAESARRTAHRVPKSLYVEGKSKAYYCTKHAENFDADDVYAVFEKKQRNRLLKLCVAGLLGPADIPRLLKTLRQGFIDGQSMPVENRQRPLKCNSDMFVMFGEGLHKTLKSEAYVGSRISKKTMIVAAAQTAAQNTPVTLFYWSFTTLFHRRFFDGRGFWVQTGGLFGKSNRRQSYFRFNRVLTRGLKEISDLKKTRKIGKISFFRFKRLSKVINVTKK